VARAGLRCRSAQPLPFLADMFERRLARRIRRANGRPEDRAGACRSHAARRAARRQRCSQAARLWRGVDRFGQIPGRSYSTGRAEAASGRATSSQLRISPPRPDSKTITGPACPRLSGGRGRGHRGRRGRDDSRKAGRQIASDQYRIRLQLSLQVCKDRYNSNHFQSANRREALALVHSALVRGHGVRFVTRST
jgi:hypothetical protein